MSTQTAQQAVTYKPPKTFAERARPLLDRGIPVIPVAPHGKNATLKDWNTADFGWRDALAWDQEANVGCVTANGFCYLDDDKGNLHEVVEKETGVVLKRDGYTMTYTVQTAKGFHYYFRTGDKCFGVGKLVNHSAANFGFDFQNREMSGARFYVVGPGSVHPSGAIYTPLNPYQSITEIPDKLVEWLKANAEQRTARVSISDDMPKLHEDFDFDNWLDHYELTVCGDGPYYGFDECPIAGYKHEGQNDISCAMFYDGEGFGFKCHAAGCPGNENGLQHLIAHLDETHGPHPDPLWARQDPAKALKTALEFGAQIAEDTKQCGLQAETEAKEEIRRAEITKITPEDLAAFEKIKESGKPVERFAFTDLGNAERFQWRNAGKFVWTANTDWLAYENGVWVKDEGKSAERAMHTTVRLIELEVELYDDEEMQDACIGWAKRSESNGKINASLERASALVGLARNYDDFDTLTTVLNLKNGEVTLCNS